jgi:integrase
MANKPKKIGLLTLRPFIRDGAQTGQWQVDIPAQFSKSGRRQRRTFEDEASALQAAKTFWISIKAEGGIAPSHEERSELTVLDLFREWFTFEKEKVAAGKKRATSLARDTYLLHNLTKRLGHLKLDRLSDRDIQRYQGDRLKDGRAPRTVNDEVALLRQALQWGRPQGLVSRVPEVSNIPLPPPDPVALEPEQVRLLLSELKEPTRTLALLLATSGCRWSEASKLKWTEVDEVNGTIALRAYQGRTLKTAQSVRHTPLPQMTVEAIRRLPKTSEYVFPGKKPGKPISTIKKALAGASKRANLKRHGEPLNVCAQMLRSTYATWLATAHTSEHVLQDLIGHKRGSRVTQIHYLGARAQDKRHAVETLFANERFNDLGNR